MKIRRRGLRVLAVWLSAAACQDATIIVGKLKSDPSAAGSGDLGAAPPGSRQERGAGDSGPIAQAGSTGMPGDSVKAGAGGSADSGVIAGGSGRFAIEPGTRQQFCEIRGPAVRRMASPEPSCRESITRELFSYGLCACNDLQFEGTSFAIDSFDSREGAYSTGQSGVAIGVNRAFLPNAAAHTLRGSLIVAGTEPSTVMNTSLQIDGDLKTRSALTIAGSMVHVGRDLWIDGDLELSGTSMFDVGRDLNLTPGHVADPIPIGRVRRTSAFQIDAPCSCDDAGRLDIPAIVAQARMQNDNAEVQLQPNALRGAFALSLGNVECGRFWLEGVSIDIGTVLATVTKRTALFVEGDFAMNTSTVGVTTESPGELDIFVTGDLIISTATAVFGSEERPSSLRFYVNGQTYFSGLGVLAAQLYAPNARVELGGIADMYGSIIGKDIHSSGAQRLHYDRSILETDECSDPHPSCDDCRQCPEGLACIQGTCNPCTIDADCCAPLSCIGGTCRLL